MGMGAGRKWEWALAARLSFCCCVRASRRLASCHHLAQAVSRSVELQSGNGRYLRVKRGTNSVEDRTEKAFATCYGVNLAGRSGRDRPFQNGNRAGAPRPGASFCVLRSVSCVLCPVFCVLGPVFWALCSVFCVLRSVSGVLIYTSAWVCTLSCQEWAALRALLTFSMFSTPLVLSHCSKALAPSLA